MVADTLLRMTTHTKNLWFDTEQRQEIIDITAEVETAVKAGGPDHGGHAGLRPRAAGVFGEWHGQRRARVVVNVMGE